MSDDDTKGVIVHLFGPPPAVEGAPMITGRYSGCYNHAPMLDAVSRAVTCNRCKKALDPFDTLMDVAKRHEEWTRLRAEVSAMRAELEALKDEEKRVKARTKAHSRKDAQAAVAAERAKLAREMGEIHLRARDIRLALKRIEQLARVPVDAAEASLIPERL